MEVLFILIIAAGAVLLLLTGIGIRMSKFTQEQEQILEKEYQKKLREKADELVKIGYISNKYDFLVGAEEAKQILLKG